MKKAAIFLIVATGLVSGCQRTDASSTVAESDAAADTGWTLLHGAASLRS